MALRQYSKRCGGLVTLGTGFIILSETVLGPDVDYVSAATIREQKQKMSFGSGSSLALRGGWLRYVPTIVAEVQDFNEHQNLHEKSNFYLEKGTREVWIVEPDSQTTTVRTKDSIRVLERHQTLESADVLPDFQMPLSEVFED